MQAAIIAGGLGTRATEMTSGRIPKALLPVAGVPIIFRQMRVLRREGISQVSVLAGHLGDRLERDLAPEAAVLELSLQVIVEPEPLGTAGCLTALAPVTEDILIVISLLRVRLEFGHTASVRVMAAVIARGTAARSACRRSPI